MKKGIVLIPDKNGSEENEIAEWQYYGEEHGYKIEGDLCYSFLFPFIAPDEFAKRLEKIPVDTFFINDSCMIYANIYNDNKLLDELNKKGLHIFHKDLNAELESICSVISYEAKKNIKYVVESVLNEAMNDDITMAVISHERSQNFNNIMDEFIRLNIEVIPIIIPEFNDKAKNLLEKCIEGNNINRVVIVDDKLVTSEFKEVIKRLSDKYEFDYEYLNDNQEIKFNNDIRMN